MTATTNDEKIINNKFASAAPLTVIELEANTYELLKLIGAKHKYSGFRYAIKAVTMCYCNEYTNATGKDGLYDKIAQHFETTPTCVERGIRTLTEYLTENGNTEVINAVFGANTLVNRKDRTRFVTNTEFINGIVNFIIFKRDIFITLVEKANDYQF